MITEQKYKLSMKNTRQKLYIEKDSQLIDWMSGFILWQNILNQFKPFQRII